MKYVVFTFFLTSSLFAQDIIQTDRPSQSTAAYILPARRLQVESGTLFGFNFVDPDIQYYNNNYNSTLLRLGISSSSEIRIGQGYSHNITKTDSTKFQYQGLSNLMIGGKFAIWQKKGWVPPITLISHINLPYGDSEIQTNYAFMDYALATDFTILNKVNVIFNYGGTWNGFGPNYRNFYALTLGYSVNEKFNFFVEPYGFWDQINYIDQSINVGITYAVAKKFQVDLIAGFENSSVDFTNIGGGIAFYLF